MQAQTNIKSNCVLCERIVSDDGGKQAETCSGLLK